jgi:predicted cobalt transporter CbtA
MGSLGAVLKAAIIAGLIAGALTAGFHALLLEPLIERAIELEEQASQTHGKVVPEPLIDRPTQRWGLVLGFLVYGALWGLLFGVVAYCFQALRPAEWTPARFGIAVALLIGWSMAMLPFLKYPANPPGIGAPETIGYRQWLYFGFLGLSGVGTAVTVGGYYWLGRTSQAASPRRAHGALAVAAYVVYVAVVYVALPENPDPVEMPAALVWPFRVVAFLGLVLFWGALGSGFGWLVRDARTSSPAGRGKIGQI